MAQAVQLFFDSPELANTASGSASAPPPVPASSRPRQPAGREDSQGVVHLDSDDDQIDVDNDNDEPKSASASGQRASTGQHGAYEDDEAMARRLQEEMYAGVDSGGNRGGAYDDDDGVRAPIARTTETLLGPGSMYHDADPQQAALDMLRRRGHGARSSTIPLLPHSFKYPANMHAPRTRSIQPAPTIIFHLGERPEQPRCTGSLHRRRIRALH